MSANGNIVSEQYQIEQRFKTNTQLNKGDQHAFSYIAC